MNAAFLFPGQGSQYVGMGGCHLRQHPELARLFEQASDLMGLNLPRVMAKGPRQCLLRTDVAQVAIFVLSVALARLLAQQGVMLVAVAGHSLGQFSALVASGAARFEDGLALVLERARLMHESNQRCDGAMLAVAGLAPQQVAHLVSGIEQAWLANLNAPDQVILSGLRPALKQAHARVLEAGGKAVWLDVAGAYHSPLLADASHRFNEAIARTPLGAATVPLIGNSKGEVLREADALRAELHRHMLLPVQWAQTMAQLRQMPIGCLVEVGPGKILRGLSLRNAPGLSCLGTDTSRDLEQVLLAFKGAPPCALS